MAQKILIIDDDPEFTASTRDLLEAEDYTVVNLPGVSGALDKIKELKPDVILLDVMMESADSGLSTAKKLRDDPETSSIPVILITGISKAEHLLPSYAPNEAWPNVKTSFEKPVDPESLIKKLKEIL